MLNTSTVNQPIHAQKSRRTDAIKRRILKYYDLLPPADQDDVKQSISGRESQLAEQTNQEPKEKATSLNGSPTDIWTNRFPEDKPWHLQVLLGETVVNEAIQATGGHLTDRTVLSLLTDHPLPLYTDADETLLFMGINKLAEREVGPLKPILSTEAAQRFGLAKLEEASEKSYTRLY